MREIEQAYGNLDPWPDRPDFLDHELASGRMVLAEVETEIAGFAGVFDYQELTYLADLFVRPGLLGAGIGKALLETILSNTGPRATLASSDPRALPLYTRFGMQPVTPVLYLSGSAEDAGNLPADPSERSADTANEGDLEELIDLDASASGRRRPAELRFLLDRPESQTFVRRAGRRAAAFAIVRTVTPRDGSEAEAFIGPCDGASAPELARISGDAIARSAVSAMRIHLTAFGAHPLLRELLRAGFRVDAMDTFMATNPGLVDGSRYAPSPEFG